MLLIRKIKNLFSQAREKKKPMLDPKSMMHMVLETEQDDIDCDQTFEFLHQYAELLVAGADTSALLPKVKKHLEQCPDCKQELEALIRVLRNNPEQ